MSEEFYMDNRNSIDICKVFSAYWIVLIVWQNVFSYLANSAADSILKFALLGYLFFSYIRMGKKVRGRNLMLLILLSVSLCITFFSFDYSNSSLGTIVYYLYPVISLFLMYCVGSECIVSKNQVEKMNNNILLVLIISIIYTIVFHPNQYINAVRAQGSGYGNELCSFFASMHEYALYLFYGLTICINRLADRTRSHGRYIILFIAFLITMILTFSRTAIAACLVYVLIYAFINRKYRIGKFIISFLILGIIIILIQPALSSFLFKIVWKSGLTNSRDALTQQASAFFASGDIWNKLFGHGVVETRNYFKDSVGYASVHNGYLQVMLYFGISGLLFMVGFLIRTLFDCLCFFRTNRDVALQSFVMLIFCGLVMYPQTFIIFSSSIDCFFLTAMFLVVPKYQRNAVRFKVYD